MKRKIENQTIKNEAIETKPIKKIKKEAARVKLENLKIQANATINNQLLSPQMPSNFYFGRIMKLKHSIVKCRFSA